MIFKLKDNGFTGVLSSSPARTLESEIRPKNLVYVQKTTRCNATKDEGGVPIVKTPYFHKPLRMCQLPIISCPIDCQTWRYRSRTNRIRTILHYRTCRYDRYLIRQKSSTLTFRQSNLYKTGERRDIIAKVKATPKAHKRNKQIFSHRRTMASI